MQEPLNELMLYTFCPHCGSTLHLKTIDNEEVKACENCGFIFWNKSKPVVSIVLHQNRKILMLQRAREPFKDYWVLPGGFISYRETAEETIIREAHEELGIAVRIEKIIGTYLIDNDPRGMHLDIIFLGTAENKIKLSSEDTQWKYFSPETLPDKIAYKHREAILDWYKNK